ncbi:MAG: hypothetical protein IPM38_16985 [Ignavibacteria bacterium]|nr:hypothetical protein [Ignavibacteria bacterium]
MKTLINFIIPLILFAVTGLTYPQSKGQVHLGIGSALLNVSTVSGNTGITGSLFNSYNTGTENSKVTTSSSFSFLVGYFPVDRLRADGGFSINAYKQSDAAIYFNLGARYYYYSDKKIMLNGGVIGNFGISNGTKRRTSNLSSTGSDNKNPINLNIVPIEFQYWPFEGGGLTTDFTYTWIFLNGGDKNKEKSFGLNVGLLIRLN